MYTIAHVENAFVHFITKALSHDGFGDGTEGAGHSDAGQELAEQP